MPVAPKKIAYYNSPQHRLYLSLVMDSDSHAKGHDQGHRHDVARSARGSLKIALIITSTFLVAEFLGALYTNSLALLADSGHMLTDVAALSLSFFAIRFSSRRATPRMTYGFYRVEILAALLNGVFLVLVALYIFYEAYHRFRNPVAVMILWSSWILIRDAVDILLEGTPAHINIVTLREQLGHVDGVGSVHDLHVWTLTSGVLAMSCHVVAGNEAFSRTELLTRVNDVARERFHIDHTTIQIEERNIPQELVDSCNCHFGPWDRQ